MDFLMHIPAVGSLCNAAAVVVGGALGLLLGRFLPERTHRIVFQCFGLFGFLLGLDMALKARNIMIVLISLSAGAIVGELLNIDSGLQAMSERLKARCGGTGDTFTKGFVTATLLYCVGSMAIVGSIAEGVGGSPRILMTKAVMDGVVSILFAASLGVGVLFSAIPLLIYEGSLTLAAGLIQGCITPVMLDDLCGTGGLMIVGIGLNLLEIVDIKTANLLPGLLITLLLSAFFG